MEVPTPLSGYGVEGLMFRILHLFQCNGFPQADGPGRDAMQQHDVQELCQSLSMPQGATSSQ